VRLFRLFGIDFSASWSWLFLFAALVYAAGATFEAVLPDHRGPVVWLLGLVAALLSIASLYAHELAHAVVARRFGVPVHAVSLFMLGGMAHSTRESPTPRAELLIAAAGPAMSLAIGVGGFLVNRATEQGAAAVAVVGMWLALMNVPLGVLNLVPAYPLDGGRVLRAVVWFAANDFRSGSAVAARAGQVGAVTLLLAGMLGLFSGQGAGVVGVWLLLAAWFMYTGATNAHRVVLFHETLQTLSVASAMFRNLGRIEADATLESLAEEHLQRTVNDRYPPGLGVYREDRLVGIVGVQHLRQFPAGVWDSVRVEEAMLSIGRVPRLQPDAPAIAALQLLAESGCELVAVIAEDRLLGLVGNTELARAVENQRQHSPSPVPR
jgi:Zn-dependent protease